LPEVPLALGFLTRAPGNSFFVFGLVEVALAALGASGSRVDAEMLAKVLVAFRLFEFVLLGFSLGVVLEWILILVGRAIVGVEVLRTRPVEPAPCSGGLDAWTECLTT
jgi:hypothetical protein